MKSFSELPAHLLTPKLLRDEISSKGYVLIRNLLPRIDIDDVLNEVTQVLSRSGWLKAERNLNERIANADAACGDPDPAFKSVYRKVFNLESFHALPHHPELKRIMKMIVGDRVLVHPKPIGRLIFPNSERLRVQAHQDHRFMNGDPECYTAWTPLHDCPTEAGPLRILEGSHHFGFQTHLDENLHVPEIPAGAEIGDEWAGGDINAGDVLIFHSLTVHAAAPNLSDKMRISLDCRFQDYARVVNPANLAFAGESGKSWEEIYRGWKSHTLRYYWKSLPLTFDPSRDEIEQLAQKTPSPAKRARYRRILAQIT